MSPVDETNPGTAKTKRVEVVPYNPAWQVCFEELRQHLLSILSGQDIRVEHVGSTSVPSLAAKPILDVDVVLQGGTEFVRVKTALEANGYYHVGDLGIAGREAFKYDYKPQLMSHHLYVLYEDSDELKRHITFRDWLRSHPEDREAYAQSKIAAARQFPNNIDAYIDAKSDIIFDIYRRCGLYSAQDLPEFARSVLNNRYDLRVGEMDCESVHPGISLYQAHTEQGNYYLLEWEHASSAGEQVSLNLNIAVPGNALLIPTASGQPLCSSPLATFALFRSEQDALTFLSSSSWTTTTSEEKHG